MNNVKLKNLIVNSLGKDNDDGKITSELLAEIDYDFDKGFEENVLAKIFNTGKVIRYEFDRRLKFAFRSVSIATAAAVILLMISIFLQEGNLSIDSLLGVGDGYSESMVSLLTGD
ncbi:MAG: hypothetical protein LBV26_03550 [Bacteroidales bacterium]|jgi:hypothetical protein|nr:hypothetical protein [Bacteroidales bacterium]